MFNGAIVISLPPDVLFGLAKRLFFLPKIVSKMNKDFQNTSNHILNTVLSAPF